MASSRTLATEVVEFTDRETVFKLRQEHRPRLLPAGMNSLLSFALENVDEGKEKLGYHKRMWHEKDYSHKGL